MLHQPASVPTRTGVATSVSGPLSHLGVMPHCLMVFLSHSVPLPRAVLLSLPAWHVPQPPPHHHFCLSRYRAVSLDAAVSVLLSFCLSGCCLHCLPDFLCLSLPLSASASVILSVSLSLSSCYPGPSHFKTGRRGPLTCQMVVFGTFRDIFHFILTTLQ